MLILHVLQGPDRGRKYELPPSEPQLIGRSSEALPISDSTVSRRHAELTPDDGKWFLRDLDSSNGTYVNGRRIDERVMLTPGDQIRCGSTLFVFAIAPDEKKTREVSLMPAEAFDVKIESTEDRNADSMILASPDPAQAAADHLRVIYELTALTATVEDRDKLLNRVMDLIFEEFQPDRGFILLQEKPTSRPDPVVVRFKVKPKNLDEGRIPVSRTIVQHTLEKGEGILSTNALNDSRFRSGDSVRDYGIRSAICVPIRSADTTFGVIHIDSQLANFTFTKQQLQLLNAIGQHTALAMKSAELLRSKMQTERLAAMGQTVASLSHAVKNILQGLRGGADAVELALNKDNIRMAKEGWPILSRNLDRILALTLNMLTYAKQRTLEFDLISIDRVIHEVAELVRTQCDRKRAALLLDLAANMPPIPADANALHQALMNILINAAEAVPAKRGAVTISTQFHSDRREVTIRVVDNGPGIDTDMQEHIFEAFTTTKGQRGTGLGLAVTKKIVEDHAGKILIDSTPGEGTTVSIILPSDRPGFDAEATKLPETVIESATEETV